MGVFPAVGDEPKKEHAIVLITHLDNPLKEISKRELGRVYLKKQRYWSNGERCVPIDQSGTTQMRQGFYRIVLDKDPSEMKRYWMQETMTGNASPPVTLDHSATVKRYVRKIKGGIGYIYADEVDETVKVLPVTDVPAFNALEKEESKESAEEPSSNNETTAP